MSVMPLLYFPTGFLTLCLQNYKGYIIKDMEPNWHHLLASRYYSNFTSRFK